VKYTSPFALAIGTLMFLGLIALVAFVQGAPGLFQRLIEQAVR